MIFYNFTIPNSLIVTREAFSTAISELVSTAVINIFLKTLEDYFEEKAIDKTIIACVYAM